MRSISTIISTLRTSFRDTDFTEAESELTSMEHKMRSNYNASELQRSELTLQNLRLEEENRLLRREFEISDRRVSELARELSVVKEREKKGIERYQRLMKDVRVLENEKEKISMELCEKNEEVDEKIRVLESEKSDFEVELDGLRRENEGLVVSKAKTDEEMEKMRDLEDENNDLRVELCEKCEEICDLKGVEGKNEEEIKELLKRNELLESEIERVKRKVVVLEMEKCDFKAKFDELCRENERLGADVKEKDRRIEELKREVEGLEMEKGVIMKEKEDMTGKYEELEERMFKVEDDVANWLLQNVPIAKKVMGDRVEKVISGVLSALDSEQDGWTGRVEDIVGIDSVASHLNEAEAKTTSSFETEVLSDTEVGIVNGTIGIKRVASLEVVVLSDSDCENEDHSPLSEPKRQRVLSQCRNQSMKLENCSQNSSCKFKQPVDLPNEDSELKPSIAASHRSDKFVTSKQQEVNETSGDKVKGSMSRGMVDDDSSQHNDLSPQANVSCRPEIRMLIATCRRSRHL